MDGADGAPSPHRRPRPRPCPVVVVAGTSSGVGKTTVACGLMAALRGRGLVVQPFKCGPDFLDPMHHEAACASFSGEGTDKHEGEGEGEDAAAAAADPARRRRRRSVNLDGWMLGREAVLACFERHSAGADIAVVEGVMGLFDGRDGKTDSGSTAEIAKLLGAPVVLVLDAWALARSAAAMLLGYVLFDGALRVEAVVCNKVGGESHALWIGDALAAEERLAGVRFLGGLPKANSVAVHERHLGLAMPHEMPEDQVRKLAALVERNLDVGAVHELAGTARPGGEGEGEGEAREAREARAPGEAGTPVATVTIGVVRDAAFCFYYEDNLLLLEQAGATLVTVSALHDAELPPGLDGLLIGGGYPELHAAELAANATMRASVKRFCAAGGVVLAECGGLMYLGTAVWSNAASAEERLRHPMCGVFAYSTRMTSRMHMGYVSVQATGSNPLFPHGSSCRGQVYHFSEVIPEAGAGAGAGDTTAAARAFPFQATMQTAAGEALTNHIEAVGFTAGNTVASYCHVHWGGAPEWAAAFVGRCAAAGADRERQRDVVSFVPVATEICCALGVQGRLAGITSYCDFPAEALAGVPVVCRSAVDSASMSSEEVEAAMATLKARGSDPALADAAPGLWLIDGPLLKAARPAVAFVQTTCATCDPAHDDVLHALGSAGLAETCRAVAVSPTTLEGVLGAIELVGATLGVRDAAAACTAGLRERLARVGVPPPPQQPQHQAVARARPRVLSLEGLSPPCTGGHWLPDVKAAAGAVDAMGEAGGAPARRLSWGDVAAADPDVLVLCPCGASVEKTLAELELVASQPAFWSLRATRTPRSVFILDHGFFSRPGPRLVDGVELLARVLRGRSAGMGVGGAAAGTEPGDGAGGGGGAARVLCLELPPGASPCGGKELAAMFAPFGRAGDDPGPGPVPGGGDVPATAVGSGMASAAGREDTAAAPATTPAPATASAMVTTVTTATATAASLPSADDAELQRLFDREIPVTVDDLEPEARARALKSRLPHALAKALHRRCVQLGRDSYIDPDSGYSVFSRVHLNRRPCCGNGCRHCPHGHANVPAASRARLLQW